MKTIQKGLSLSYSTLRHVALTINRDHGFVDAFKASKNWIPKFVRGCGLRSSKVTSFVTTRNLRERQQVEDAAASLVEEVKAEMANHPHSIFCNIDQCRINRGVAEDSCSSASETGSSGGAVSFFSGALIHGRSCSLCRWKTRTETFCHPSRARWLLPPKWSLVRAEPLRCGRHKPDHA